MSLSNKDILATIRRSITLSVLKKDLPGLTNIDLKNFFSEVEQLLPDDGKHTVDNGEAVLYVDGASDSSDNAGIGIVLLLGEEKIEEISKGIGKATNNVAEYTALIEGLSLALKKKYMTITINSDSELIVRQMNGQYKVKNPELQRLHLKAKKLVSKFRSVKILHLMRENNADADKLAKMGSNK